MPDFVTVANVNAIPPGSAETFTVEGRVVAVFNDQGAFRAIDDLCPHMGASLAAGAVEDGMVTCPWHAWRFRLEDGTWCDNPRLSTDTFEVRVVGEEIQVRVPPQ